MNVHVPRFWALACVAALRATVAAADGSDVARASTFGALQDDKLLAPITWETSANVELTVDSLRLMQAGAVVRSAPLALRPLQLYRVSVRMARGPGSVPRFSIAYLDARGKPAVWLPAWQLENSGHPNWLPLPPRAQRYMQGFVLPLGATEPRLQLRLDSGDKALARYDHWTLSELRVEATQSVTCCEQLGDNMLFAGDLESPARDGLPGFWAQWSLTQDKDNRVDLVVLNDEHKHVLRVRQRTTALLASSYLIPVTPGNAYRITLSARGRGRIELDVHSLSRDLPTRLRVGNATRSADSLDLQSTTWQELSNVWIAEAPNAALGQVVITVMAHDTVEIDTVELRPFVSSQGSNPTRRNP